MMYKFFQLFLYIFSDIYSLIQSFSAIIFSYFLYFFYFCLLFREKAASPAKTTRKTEKTLTKFQPCAILLLYCPIPKKLFGWEKIHTESKDSCKRRNEKP